MIVIIDYYANSNALHILSSVDLQGVGQAFTATIDNTLTSCKFCLYKSGGPTGNAYAKLYTGTGTYGTNMKPTGGALATSDAFDVSTLDGTPTWKTFTFPTPYLMLAGYYCIVVEYSGGDAVINVMIRTQSGNPHSGNINYLMSPNWFTNNDYDTAFYVYGDNGEPEISRTLMMMGVGT